MTFRVCTSEITKWAGEESARIAAGESLPYHAILCDPPYGISFMGKEWDDAGGPEAFQAQAKAWGESLKPLLHPGALVFMFAGTRMWHRLAAGMEDAGFHLWDTLMWLHGQGFPKAQDISKLIDKSQGNTRKVIGVAAGAATQNTESLGAYAPSYDVTEPSAISAPWSGHKTPQLKPAWEPVLCFRAPNQGKKYVELALTHGSGALNVTGGRVGSETTTRAGHSGDNGIYGGDSRKGSWDNPPGRYPANLALDEVSAAMLDEQTGILTSGARTEKPNKSPKNKNTFNEYNNVSQPSDASSGGASRFFYTAKASTSERNAGLEEKNNHPCCKPLSLTQWLATLLLPPLSVERRRILVPFSGSGSEMIGCDLAGWDEIVGVEMDPEYTKIAIARLRHWKASKEETKAAA